MSHRGNAMGGLVHAAQTHAADEKPMAKTKALVLLLVAAFAFAACGSQPELASEMVLAADSAASTTTTTTAPTTSSSETAASAAPTARLAKGSLVDPTLPMISYWANSEFDGRPPSLRYAMASSTRLDDLWERGDGVRIAMPFGVPPAVHSIVRVWSDDAGLAANPGPPSIWPAECVGLRPDADGDSLVDDCDPFPNDGPLADFDGDGVPNGEDNCPATPNPSQADVAESFGGDACRADDNENNRARIIFATTTVDDMNAQRAVKGLGPIEWPVVDPVLLPEVVEWCASFNALPTETDPDFAATDEVFASIPDVYGLNDTDIETMRALVAEMETLFDSLPSSGQSGFDEFRRLVTQLDRFMLILDTSDQSC